MSDDVLSKHAIIDKLETADGEHGSIARAADDDASSPQRIEAVMRMLSHALTVVEPTDAEVGTAGAVPGIRREIRAADGQISIMDRMPVSHMTNNVGKNPFQIDMSITYGGKRL